MDLTVKQYTKLNSISFHGDGQGYEGGDRIQEKNFPGTVPLVPLMIFPSPENIIERLEMVLVSTHFHRTLDLKYQFPSEPLEMRTSRPFHIRILLVVLISVRPACVNG